MAPIDAARALSSGGQARPARDAPPPRVRAFGALTALAAAWLASGVVACGGDEPQPMRRSAARVGSPGPAPRAAAGASAARRVSPPPRDRLQAAAVVVTFVNRPVGARAPVAVTDQLRVAAAFADLDRRDLDILYALVGLTPVAQRPLDLDSCALRPAGRDVARPAPVAWLQLLDVGDVQIEAGGDVLRLVVSMVPSMFGAVRGVRYDVDRISARALLGHGPLRLRADGGDGVPALDATIDVPRPLRISRLAGQPVRSGGVDLAGQPADLELTWGSVDGLAELELRITADAGGEPASLHCRLRDDGAFTVPAALLDPWRVHAPRSWWLTMTRSVQAPLRGFPGEPLRLEWVDHARLQVRDHLPTSSPRRRALALPRG